MRHACGVLTSQLVPASPAVQIPVIGFTAHGGNAKAELLAAAAGSVGHTTTHAVGNSAVRAAWNQWNRNRTI